ncbi:hypothetical protein [Pseudomonas sp. S1(2024)]|uniref:hypothetical protein n=1 Tax=Pseudomonas sp. S1(2024) TaxID=3390191 RepID=UPI00397AEE76
MKMIKRLLWGALLCLPLCHSAIAGNEIRMEAPVRYVTAGEWLPADPLLGEPYDVNETCDDWAPSTDSMMEGLEFEQSTTCTTTSSQSVQQRELYSTTGVYRNVGPTTVKTSSREEHKTQQAIGTQTSTSGFTVLNAVAGRNGIYQVTNGSTTFSAYVDMTTDGGKWVLVARWTSLANATFNNVVVKGQPIKGVTNDSANYPIIPAGIINSSDKVLIANGNSSWIQAYGAWQRFETLPADTNLNYSGIPAVSPSGSYLFYHPGAGWASAQTMTAPFGLWTTPNRSGACGGANTPGTNRMCPVLGTTYAQHADSTNEKRLYLKAR